MKNIEELSGEKSGELANRQKKHETKRAMGAGRRTREGRVKMNQMAALKFQSGGRHQTSSASLRGAFRGIYRNST